MKLGHLLSLTAISTIILASMQDAGAVQEGVQSVHSSLTGQGAAPSMSWYTSLFSAAVAKDDPLSQAKELPRDANKYFVATSYEYVGIISLHHPDKPDVDILNELSDGAVEMLDASAVNTLSPSTAWQLSPALLNKLPDEVIGQLNADVFNRLPSSTIAKLDERVFKELSHKTMDALDTYILYTYVRANPDAGVILSAERLNKLPKATLNILEAQVLNRLPKEVLAELDARVWNELSADAIGGLTADTLRQLPDATIKQLSGYVLTKLSPEAKLSLKDRVNNYLVTGYK